MYEIRLGFLDLCYDTNELSRKGFSAVVEEDRMEEYKATDVSGV